jgi:hypothetical protein
VVGPWHHRAGQLAAFTTAWGTLRFIAGASKLDAIVR